jgi:hypothetical protein
VEDGAASRWPASVTMREFQAVLINPTGELTSPRNGFEANSALNQQDAFQLNEVDERIVAGHGTQLAGHVLIDRRGIVRWVRVEARERIADIGAFPTDEETLAAVRDLPG